MKPIERAMNGTDLPHATCRYCHQEIVEVPDIGWLDPKLGDSYDMCPESRYAAHEPAEIRGASGR